MTKKSYAQRAIEEAKLIKKAFIIAVYQDLERIAKEKCDPSLHPSNLVSGVIERMARNIRKRMIADEPEAYRNFVRRIDRKTIAEIRIC